MKAVFLGRFQPLHRGHHHIIEEYRDEYREFAVAIGSPEKSRTRKNPLNAEERKEMIHACFPDMEIVEVQDEDRGDEGHPIWTRRLMEKTDADTVISGNDLVQRLVRKFSDGEIVEIQHHEPEIYSGTEIRRKIRKGEEWRGLVPECCLEEVERYEEVIRESVQIQDMDHSRAQEEIESFLSEKLDEAGAEGYVIGVSGGIDSALTLKLAVEAVGSENVHGWIMPGDPSDEENMEDAREICRELDVETWEVDIEPVVEAFKGSLDTELEKNTVGNIRARARMIYEYIDANESDMLVLGSGNRTEYLLGYFTKYGDGAADLRPIQDLYKTEVKQLAKQIGLDQKFIEKKPTAGLWKGQNDEDELGAPYQKIDRILKHMEKGLKPEEIASKPGIEKEEVERFQEMKKNSKHKRSQVPYPELR